MGRCVLVPRCVCVRHPAERTPVWEESVCHHSEEPASEKHGLRYEPGLPASPSLSSLSLSLSLSLPPLSLPFLQSLSVSLPAPLCLYMYVLYSVCFCVSSCVCMRDFNFNVCVCKWPVTMQPEAAFTPGSHYFCS